MVDQADHSRGVLIDLSHAIRVEVETDRLGYLSMGQRCMALDLLVATRRPRHIYRHDLESFSWTFWDITFNYSGGIRVSRKTKK